MKQTFQCNRHWVQKAGDEILKELRKAITISANHCNNELETIRRSQEKLKTSLAKTKAELKAMNSRMNNTEERISDLEDIIMETCQSKEQRESQILLKMKTM